MRTGDRGGTGRTHTLKDNGNLAAQPNTRDAATPAEWRRRRLLYDITSRGDRVEELLRELDSLREEASALESWRLLTIRDGLRRLASAPASEHPDAQRVSEDLEQVIAAVTALSKGATDFINRLQRFTATDKLTSEEFLAHQDAVVEYLQDFHRSLRAHTDAILDAVREMLESVHAIVDTADRFIARGALRGKPGAGRGPVAAVRLLILAHRGCRRRGARALRAGVRVPRFLADGLHGPR
jgi:uncharacterized protein (TIGR02677 family)